MRFSPKARLDTSRVRDRGRGSPGPIGAGRSIGIPTGRGGLGIGGLLLVVGFVILTSCLNGGLPGLDGGAQPGTGQDRTTGTDRYQACEDGADANANADCARVAVENSLVAYWSAELPEQAGTRLRPAGMATFTGRVETGCGAASSQVGPFYCPVDQTIYLDTTFFPEVLERQLGGSGGDFVEPYVIGHEYGHHIQNLLGTMAKVRTQQGPRSDAVRLELQADCYAGMWAAAAESTQDASGVAIFEAIDDADIAEALDGAKAVGDDRIQQRGGGRVDPDGWTHGSSEQRMRWFMTGFERGTLQACDTFAADAL